MPGRPVLQPFAWCAGVALATAALWWKTTAFAFTNLDDERNLLANPHFRGLARERLEWMASTRWMGHWQPATWFSYALDFARAGLDPSAFHLTQVLLHALGAAVVFALARALFADLSRARGAALDAAATVAALSWSLHSAARRARGLGHGPQRRAGAAVPGPGRAGLVAARARSAAGVLRADTRDAQVGARLEELRAALREP